MSQPEFHAAYEAMPPDYRAELIDGIVHEPSPVSYEHGAHHASLSLLFKLYSMQSAGLQMGDNASVILGPRDEVQPDVFLRIAPGLGGRTKDIPTKRNANHHYIAGAPELVAGVATSSRKVDLGAKKGRYANGGVLEYIVLCLDPDEFFWFDLATCSRLKPHPGGIYQSKLFPGLWINSQALLKMDDRLCMDTLEAGMKTREFEEFIAKLDQRS